MSAVIQQGWTSAVESLAGHKLRAGLTLLTIVVGVAAVLLIDVFGQLTEQAVARNFGPLGATLVNISPEVPPPPPGAGAGPGGGPVQVSADFAAGGAKPTFTMPPDMDLKDLQALSGLPHVAAAALHAAIPPVQAIANGQNGQARLLGATPQIQSIFGYQMAAGSFYTEQDEAARANVVVIGASVARTLFPDMDPVGQSVQLNNVSFTIKGVLAPQGSNGELSLDQIGLVPYSVADRLRGNRRMFAITSTNPVVGNGASLQVDDVHNVAQVEASATQLLQQLHPPKPGEQPFVASDFTQAVQTANQSTSQVRLALGGIAGVMSLLGAFGLFSMLTVSITERTREIGLRLAVGARTRDVLAQFLTEAALLGLLGGLIGVCLATALSAVAPALVRPLSGNHVLPSLEAVVGVVTGSVVLGLLFGLVPARRAANLDPANALRRA